MFSSLYHQSLAQVLRAHQMLKNLPLLEERKRRGGPLEYCVSRLRSFIPKDVLLTGTNKLARMTNTDS